jgi:hypothetical protein
MPFTGISLSKQAFGRTPIDVPGSSHLAKKIRFNTLNSLGDDYYD